MAGIRQEGDFLCTIERQATWGTPISTAPIGLNTEDMQITMEGDRHMIPVDRGIRMNYEVDRFVDTVASIPVVKFSAPITVGMLKTVMPGLLQKSTDWTVAAGAIISMFPEAPANLPTPRAITGGTGGYAYTIARRSPTASQGERISDCICRSLKLSLHPTNNGGLLWGEWEFIGTTYSHSVNLLPTASPVPTQDPITALVRYSWGGITTLTTYNTTAINTDFQSFEASLSFGAKFAGDTVRGEVLFPRFEGNLTLTCGQNAATQAAEAASRSQAVDTGIAVVIAFGPSSTGSAITEAGEMQLLFFGSVEKFDDMDRKEGETHVVTLSLEKGSASTITEYPFNVQWWGV